MKLIAATALVAALFSACFAQQAPPRPAELDKLDFIAGDFDCVDTFTMPAGEKTEVKSKTVSKWALDKRYIRYETFGEMPGMGKFEGMMMLTWNELIGKYEATWFDSAGGWSIKAHGDKVENDTLVLTSEEETIPEMGTMQFRLTYKKLDAKKVEFKLDMKMGDDWMNQMTSVLTRKG